MAEATVGVWEPVTVMSPKQNVGVALLVIGLIVLAFGIMFWPLAIVGLILIVPGVMLRWGSRLKTQYVLTSRRAMVYSVSTRERQTTRALLQSCDLVNATVTVINRRVSSVSQTSGGGVVGAGGAVAVNATTVGRSEQIGTVLFFVGGMPVVRFAEVRDPDGIEATAKMVIGSLLGVRT